MSEPGCIAVALKWVDVRTSGFSLADAAALECALLLGEAWQLPVAAITAGPPAAQGVLRDAAAFGPQRLVFVTADIDAPSEAIAEALAPLLDGAAVVCCGDYSADRGSGSVPAFLAHQLEAAQALGLTGLTPRSRGCLIAQRRLDGGRREHLQVTAPAVISLEPGAARLRRAPLSGLLAAREATIEVTEGAVTHRPRVQVMHMAPYRPRPKILPPPHDPLPRARLLALTGALTERTPPRVVRAPCDEAADELIRYLKDKGYLT